MRDDPRSRPLVTASIELIRRHQAATGAYVAAPGYGTYAYSWLRDGAFIAAAMDRYGHHDSAAAFHMWAAHTVARYAPKVKLLEAEADVALRGTGDPLHPIDDRYVLHTRFTVDGDEGNGHWGNFQLDGYGFWLTSLARHLKLTVADPGPYCTAIDVVGRYLTLTWQHPCYDSWEEYPTRRHTTTWAAVAKGLHDVGHLTGNAEFLATSDEITGKLIDDAAPGNTLPKFVPEAAQETDSMAPEIRQPSRVAVAGHERIGHSLSAGAVDGSALLVLGSFGPFAANHKIVSQTLETIESQLVAEGGVHRYLGDEYYGGGLWIVLAGALAWVHAANDRVRAREILGWIEAQADTNSHLGEQTDSHLCQPEMRLPWIDRWGLPAKPLLWSHAMYLLGAAATG